MCFFFSYWWNIHFMCYSSDWLSMMVLIVADILLSFVLAAEADVVVVCLQSRAYCCWWRHELADCWWLSQLHCSTAVIGYHRVRPHFFPVLFAFLATLVLFRSSLTQTSSLIGLWLLACRYHYPGSYSPPRAQSLPIPLYASEEYSAVNDLHGGGCWARVWLLLLVQLLLV